MSILLGTDWVVGVGTLLLAAATFALGGAALWQVIQSREAVAEHYRGRVDDLAPKVTVVTLQPEHQPYAPSETGTSQPIEPRQTFTMPQDADSRILVRTQAYLMNEGGTTAVVELGESITLPDPPVWSVSDSGERKLENLTADPALDAAGLPPLAAMVYLFSPRWALLPGRIVALRCTANRTVSEWVDAWHRRGTRNPATIRFEVRVLDQYDGVEDRATIEVEAYPLLPITGNDAAWRIPISGAGNEQFDRACVLPIERTYLRV